MAKMLAFEPSDYARFPDLLEHLRDEYYGGEFAVIIRRGKIIELSGIVSIASPLRSR